MGVEELKQIGEIVKTWNLNIDSQTALQIATTLSPYLMWWMLKDVIMTVLGLATVLGCVTVASRVVMKIIKRTTEE